MNGYLPEYAEREDMCYVCNIPEYLLLLLWSRMYILVYSIVEWPPFGVIYLPTHHRTLQLGFTHNTVQFLAAICFRLAEAYHINLVVYIRFFSHIN